MPWTLDLLHLVRPGHRGAEVLSGAPSAAGRVSVALIAGLTVNVALNLALLPRLGLLGAVLATAAAHFIALTLIITMSSRLGFRVDRGTWAALLLPAALCLGAWNAALLLAVVALYIAVSDRLLSREEKHTLAAGIAEYAGKLWTASAPGPPAFRLSIRVRGRL